MLTPEKKALFTVLFFFVLSAVYFAQEKVNPDSALQNIIHQIQGEELTLKEAQQAALNNSSSLLRAEAVYLAAAGSLRRERGFYDPEFYFRLEHQDIEQPAASFFAGADVLLTEQTNSVTGLRLKLPIGTELNLALNTATIKTNSQFAFLNPEYNAFGTLSLRQSLLRGFAASARKDLSLAEYRFNAAQSRYEQEKVAVSTVTEQLYWELYSAERDYAVQKITRDRAENFLKDTELRHKAGLVGPNQVANARTFLAEQELLLIDREEQLDGFSDRLAAFIGKRPGKEFVRYKVTDNPPENFTIEPVEDLIDKAFNNNLEVLAVKEEIAAAGSLVDASQWEYLPRIDLFGSIISTGLGGNPRNVIFGSDTLRSATSGSFGDVLNQVFNQKYPGWSVGVELSLPIGLRPGLGERDRLEAEASYMQHHYTEFLRILENQVRKAHRELGHGNERLKAASEGVGASQEQVRIGMIEFENGRITAFELVRLSEDFATAQRRYSQALVQTVNAAAVLKQLTSGKYIINGY